MSAKLPEPKKPLREVIRENWLDQLELGGSKSGFRLRMLAGHHGGYLDQGLTNPAQAAQFASSRW
jgi:hypothetical protein